MIKINITESNEVDTLFTASKQKILDLLNKMDKKSTKIFSRAKETSWDDIFAVVDMLRKDEDILNAIMNAGVTAKLKYTTNRYAQALPEVTFMITNFNPRNPGWSKWN